MSPSWPFLPPWQCVLVHFGSQLPRQCHFETSYVGGLLARCRLTKLWHVPHARLWTLVGWDPGYGSPERSPPLWCDGERWVDMWDCCWCSYVPFVLTWDCESLLVTSCSLWGSTFSGSCSELSRCVFYGIAPVGASLGEGSCPSSSSVHPVHQRRMPDASLAAWVCGEIMVPHIIS